MKYLDLEANTEATEHESTVVHQDSIVRRASQQVYNTWSPRCQMYGWAGGMVLFIILFMVVLGLVAKYCLT